MKPQIKEKWIAALRSGKYKQGHAVLKQTYDDQDLYCCLGVLCDLYIKDKKLKRTTSIMRGSYLPLNVQEWSGLRDGEGSYGNGNLVHDNDLKRKSFKQIANIIEKYL